MTISGSQIAALGSRLRASNTPDPKDVALLGEVLIQFNRAMEEVAAGLDSIGLKATTRLKSTGTIVDKLKRTFDNLKSMQDLAGARVVQRMTLDQQDEAADRILSFWPGARLIDRRATPSHGYRAVHIIPRIDKCKVEIQLRTMYQDTWAQFMELLGDAFGRDVRYGGPPNTPDEQVTETMTRGQFVNFWIAQSEELHRAAECENELARLERDGQQDSQRAVELRGIIEEELGPLRRIVREMHADFAGRTTDGTG